MTRFLLAICLCLLFNNSIVGQNSSARFEGQVICCADCWGEKDRTKVEFGTAEDLLKAKSCVEGGDPTLLAVREGDSFKLYQLALGKFRLPGKNWLEFVGKRISVTGTIQNKKDLNTIRVDSVNVLAPSLAEQQASKLVGQEVSLALRDLSGVEQTLASLKGRVVVLNFWATYCIPCRTEMPDLAAIQNEFAALGVQTIGASTDAPEDRNKVLQFVRETKINFPVWVGASSSDMIGFGLGAALPGTVVVGRDGRIAKVMSGVVNQTELRKLLNEMLNAPVSAKVEKRPAEVSSVPS
jgi:thiol-disulfide isomerase/thioredoxin